MKSARSVNRKSIAVVNLILFSNCHKFSHRVIVQDKLNLIKVDQLPDTRVIRRQVIQQAQRLPDDRLRVTPILEICYSVNTG